MTTTKQIDPAVMQQVKRWEEKILSARKKYEDDFTRFRENMEFVAGLQWAGQESITHDKYVANITLRTLNQKKSVLYAKNPTCEAKRRERLDFQLWDGKMETLMSAYQSAMTNPMDIQSLAVLNDYMIGMQRRQVIDRIGDTLRLSYEWNVDDQEPSFKSQMKDLVDRVLVCGVGYVKLSFVRNSVTPLADGLEITLRDRAQRAKAILARLEEQDVDEESVLEDLRLLLTNQVTSATEDAGDVQEKLLFQFLPSTSVIPDPACRSLRGFTGARWIAHEFNLPITEVNEFFEVKLQDTKVKRYGADSLEPKDGEASDNACEETVRVWEVFDKRTMTHCFICEGYEDYLQAPEPMVPQIKHFWNIFPLTFNRVETEPGLKVTIFPPSDVDLIRHAQKEWNRSRDALRTHRKANAPKYVTSASLSQEDVERIESAAPHTVVKLQSIPDGTDVSKLFVPVQHVHPNPVLYDTGPLQQDILQAVGMQEANLGPVSGNETATGQTIAEQSRMSASASNVDDLDEFLSLLYRAGGEMLLREMSEITAKMIAGVGAVWPENYREMFLTDVYLEIAAASSGRPNKAMDVATFERLAPLLIQAGANPQAIVREGARRLGDNVDIPSFFPLMPIQAPAMGGAAQPQQPLQELPSQAPVPLPAA